MVWVDGCYSYPQRRPINWISQDISRLMNLFYSPDSFYYRLANIKDRYIRVRLKGLERMGQRNYGRVTLSFALLLISVLEYLIYVI